MPRQQQRGRLIGKRPSLLAIGRVAHHCMHALPSDKLTSGSHVRRVYTDSFLQPIQRDRAPSHVRHFRLDLKRFKTGVQLFLAEQQRQNTGAGSHIGYPFTGPEPGKICKKHRVHPEAEGPRMLNDVQSVALQIVQTFAGFKQVFGHGTTSR